jgi:hypothetical protein
VHKEVVAAANSIFRERYADAVVAFAAGSILRGEGTRFSDIDLVVVYAQVPHAFRESFRFGGFPVEAFVHDPETFNYFAITVDCASGVPSLPQMVLEGVEIPGANELSRSLKSLATSMLEAGPPPLSDEDQAQRRYAITDLVDDLRDPRSKGELVATGSVLFEQLADYCLRVRGLWSGRGKSVPRALGRADATLCARFLLCFEDLFERGDAGAAIRLSEELLAPHGGFYFEGFRRDAPPDWRKPLGS